MKKDRADGKTLVHIIILAVVTFLCLIPFSGKAFNMDDTLFLWTAKQILKEPFDFYGFAANWGGTLAQAIDIIKNPPLASYYIALTAIFTGFGERALHTAFILPAIGFSIGAYLVARRFTGAPLLAALASVLTPVLIVSANTVMSDVMMLFFFVWAIVLWMRGLENDSRIDFLAGGVLIAAASLTKYFAISLIPLLFVYSALSRPRSFRWALWMIVPVIILAAYQLGTEAMYGRGLLTDASSYARTVGAEGGGFFEKTFVGVVFTGGCLITVLFYAPLLWGRKALIAGAAIAFIIGAAMLRIDALSYAPLHSEDGYSWNMIIHIALFGTAGAGVLALTVMDLVRKREPASVFLSLWVFGTFIFSVYMNWTINARSLLPIAPAAGILIARGLEYRGKLDFTRSVLPLIPALIISIMVAWADYRLANTARQTAEAVIAKYSGQGSLWFQGHWGFQYYMETGGARPIDRKNTVIMPGDIVVFPFNNVNLWMMPQDKVRTVEAIELDFPAFLTTMTLGPGAGFYASEWGPLPYVFAPRYREAYLVMQAVYEIGVDTP